MSDDEEWGPWIEHDGKSKPCLGLTLEAEWASGLVAIVRLAKGAAPLRRGSRHELNYYGPTYSSAWFWDSPGPYTPIVRYRIRKPRALRDLIAMVENLPAPAAPKVAPKVDA